MRKLYPKRETGKFAVKIVVEYDGRHVYTRRSVFPGSGASWDLITDNNFNHRLKHEAERTARCAMYEALFFLGFMDKDGKSLNDAN